MLYWKSLLYELKIVRTQIISRHYNDLLVGQYRIEKTQELIMQKYY